jgi:hypothetical protein
LQPYEGASPCLFRPRRGARRLSGCCHHPIKEQHAKLKDEVYVDGDFYGAANIGDGLYCVARVGAAALASRLERCVDSGGGAEFSVAVHVSHPSV